VVEILQCGPNWVHEHDYVARNCSQMYFNHDTYGDGNCGCVTQFPRNCTLPANQESHPTALRYKLDAPRAAVTCRGNCGCVTQFPRDCTMPSNQESHPTALIYKLDEPMAVVTCTWDVDVTIQLRTRGPRRLPRPRHRERCENAGGLFNGCGGIRASSTPTAMFGRRLTSRSRLAGTHRPIVWVTFGDWCVRSSKERLGRMGPRSGHVTDRSRARPRRHSFPNTCQVTCPAGYHRAHDDQDISSEFRCNSPGILIGELPICEPLVCDKGRLSRTGRFIVTQHTHGTFSGESIVQHRHTNLARW
jgi:hypothetical protein